MSPPEKRFCDRPLVYVAAPYRAPYPVDNTRKAILAADFLHRTGKVSCVVPHLNMVWDLVRAQSADYWLEYDLSLLARCDALYRLPGDSPGADREETFAKEREIPIFYEQTPLLYWAAQWGQS